MICPNCPGNVEMVYIGDHWQCPICNGQWWPPEKPERGAYKIKPSAPIDSPKCLIWGTQNIDYKPPLPAGEPIFKGGGSKCGKKRKKPVKRDIRAVYET